LVKRILVLSKMHRTTIKIVNKIYYKYFSAFVGYLYILVKCEVILFPSDHFGK